MGKARRGNRRRQGRGVECGGAQDGRRKISGSNSLKSGRPTLAEAVSWVAWKRCFTQEEFLAAMGAASHWDAAQYGPQYGAACEEAGRIVSAMENASRHLFRSKEFMNQLSQADAKLIGAAANGGLELEGREQWSDPARSRIPPEWIEDLPPQAVDLVNLAMGLIERESDSLRNGHPIRYIDVRCCNRAKVLRLGRAQRSVQAGTGMIRERLEAALCATEKPRADEIQRTIKAEIEAEDYAVSREQVRKVWRSIEHVLKPKLGRPFK